MSFALSGNNKIPHKKDTEAAEKHFAELRLREPCRRTVCTACIADPKQYRQAHPRGNPCKYCVPCMVVAPKSGHLCSECQPKFWRMMQEYHKTRVTLQHHRQLARQFEAVYNIVCPSDQVPAAALSPYSPSSASSPPAPPSPPSSSSGGKAPCCQTNCLEQLMRSPSFALSGDVREAERQCHAMAPGNLCVNARNLLLRTDASYIIMPNEAA